METGKSFATTQVLAHDRQRWRQLVHRSTVQLPSPPLPHPPPPPTPGNPGNGLGICEIARTRKYPSLGAHCACKLPVRCMRAQTPVVHRHLSCTNTCRAQTPVVHKHLSFLQPVSISRFPDQNGVSRQYNMLEIHHSGQYNMLEIHHSGPEPSQLIFQSSLMYSSSLAQWLRRPPRQRQTWLPSPAVVVDVLSRSSHTSDFTTDHPVATLPGAWRYRVSAGTGWPGVSIL